MASRHLTEEREVRWVRRLDIGEEIRATTTHDQKTTEGKSKNKNRKSCNTDANWNTAKAIGKHWVSLKREREVRTGRRKIDTLELIPAKSKKYDYSTNYRNTTNIVLDTTIVWVRYLDWYYIEIHFRLSYQKLLFSLTCVSRLTGIRSVTLSAIFAVLLT